MLGNLTGRVGILADLSVERYDPTRHAWRPRPMEPYYRWAIIQPELDVEEIAAEGVAAVIEELTFGRGAGRRRGPDRPRRDTRPVSEQ